MAQNGTVEFCTVASGPRMVRGFGWDTDSKKIEFALLRAEASSDRILYQI